MKVLDFGSSDELRVRMLWLHQSEKCREILQKNVGKNPIGELEIHCLDLPGKALPKEISRGNQTINGHMGTGTLPSGLDLICALHPDPRIMSNESPIIVIYE